MQLLPRYLVSNRTDIIADVAGFITEYRPVYKRQLQVYKGIDNVLEFRLLNADQKPINTQGYTPKFRAFDENNNLVISRDGTVLDDGSTATKGLFTVTVTENDILNLKQQFLKYNIYLVDANDEKILTYTDTHFGADATIKINAEAFPGPRATKDIASFLETGNNSNVWVSSAIDAEPGINGNEALHTIAIYSNGYVGSITVQATLDNQAGDETDWADIETIVLDGSETAPIPANVYGVFNYLRFSTNSDPANTIAKILVRN